MSKNMKLKLLTKEAERGPNDSRSTRIQTDGLWVVGRVGYPQATAVAQLPLYIV